MSDLTDAWDNLESAITTLNDDIDNLGLFQESLNTSLGEFKTTIDTLSSVFATWGASDFDALGVVYDNLGSNLGELQTHIEFSTHSYAQLAAIIDLYVQSVTPLIVQRDALVAEVEALNEKLNEPTPLEKFLAQMEVYKTQTGYERDPWL